ncbi:MAG: CCA tRNA nucleotidyltransferase [Gemmatimonadota bacterium]|nr:CCA tRNA nucleotidyltransferase [Gemmatimonadota bacterium]
MASAFDTAIEVVRRLDARGFRALLAGGCVRDLQLGMEPRDYDVATDADPQQVTGIFPNARPVGAHFGVVAVRLGGHGFEVARFRRDLGYSDGRHPDAVEFADETEDARRRDFTINGMFWDPLADRLLDYVGGQADLRQKTIRTIGPAEDRFAEDRLRMMRAVRLGCRLHWRIDAATFAAIRRSSESLSEVSVERVRDEFVRILTEGGAPLGVRWLIDSGLMNCVAPEVLELDGVAQPPEYHPEGDVLTHTLIMLGLMRNPSPELAVAVLLHDVGKPRTFRAADRIRFDNHAVVGAQISDGICRRLRFSGEATRHIGRLVADHHRFMHVRQMRASTLKRFLRLERFEEHLELHRVDCLSSHRNLENYHFCRQAMETLEPEEIRPEPLITGRDLIELGYTPGPAFTAVLRAVEDGQLDGSVRDRESALRVARGVFERGPEPGCNVLAENGTA